MLRLFCRLLFNLSTLHSFQGCKLYTINLKLSSISKRLIRLLHNYGISVKAFFSFPFVDWEWKYTHCMCTSFFLWRVMILPLLWTCCILLIFCIVFSSVQSQWLSLFDNVPLRTRRALSLFDNVPVENQKGAIIIQRCSVENQKSAIIIQQCSM